MGFLHNYTEYSSGNEAPPIFHIWSALSTLSAIISRRVWTKQGMFVHYPNLYVMLVGPPGDGKTTAMSIGKRVLRQVGDIPLSATAATPQAIMQLMEKSETNKKPLQRLIKLPDGRLDEYTPLAIFATEFSQFIGMNPPGWIDFLTTVFDEEVYEVNTKNQGSNLIPGPYITLLGCMTDDTTSSYLKQNIISGGFSRRCIFVYSTGRGAPQPFPVETPEQLTAWESCISWGKKIREVSGEFQWTSSARDFYSEFYIRNRTTIDRENDPATVGYHKTKPVQLIKIAMLLVLSETTELILDKPYLELGLALLEKAEINLSKVFAGTGRNELANVAAKIDAFMSTMRQPMATKKLRAIFFKEASGTEFDQVMFHLQEAGKVQKASITKGTTKIEVYTTPEITKNFQKGTDSGNGTVDESVGEQPETS